MKNASQWRYTRKARSETGTGIYLCTFDGRHMAAVLGKQLKETNHDSKAMEAWLNAARSYLVDLLVDAQSKRDFISCSMFQQAVKPQSTCPSSTSDARLENPTKVQPLCVPWLCRLTRERIDIALLVKMYPENDQRNRPSGQGGRCYHRGHGFIA